MVGGAGGSGASAGTGAGAVGLDPHRDFYAEMDSDEYEWTEEAIEWEEGMHPDNLYDDIGDNELYDDPYNGEPFEDSYNDYDEWEAYCDYE